MASYDQAHSAGQLDAAHVLALTGERANGEQFPIEATVSCLDVQMPGINGFETARLIKSRERTR
jgi:CheY-like chemotaxis protein